jgi:hypothetical protein
MRSTVTEGNDRFEIWYNAAEVVEIPQDREQLGAWSRYPDSALDLDRSARVDGCGVAHDLAGRPRWNASIVSCRADAERTVHDTAAGRPAANQLGAEDRERKATAVSPSRAVGGERTAGYD